MRRESPDELTRLVVTALAVFIGGTAALVANDTIRAYRLEIAAKQAVIELNKELARQDKAAAQAEATRQAKQAAQKKAQELPPVLRPVLPQSPGLIARELLPCEAFA